MTFKIAIIGCGWVSTACHGPACAEYAALHPDVELAACCDVNSERAESLRAQVGFQRSYTDYAAMLEAERPQAVCLAVPPQVTCAAGCDILQRGYPLLTEKPPGLTVQEIDRLISAAQSSGAIHQVAFNRRFMPLAAELKQRLAGQAIYHIDVQQARVHRTNEQFATTAVHVVDSARFFSGSDYQHLDLAYQEMPELGPGAVNYTLDGRFDSGATVHLGIFPVAGLNIERTTIFAKEKTFFFDANNGPDAPGRLRCYEEGRLIADLGAFQWTGRREDYYLNGFYHEDAAFFDAVRTGSQPALDFRSARQSIEIMQGMIERKTWYQKEF